MNPPPHLQPEGPALSALLRGTNTTSDDTEWSIFSLKLSWTRRGDTGSGFIQTRPRLVHLNLMRTKPRPCTGIRLTSCQWTFTALKLIVLMIISISASTVKTARPRLDQSKKKRDVMEDVPKCPHLIKPSFLEPIVIVSSMSSVSILCLRPPADRFPD